MVYIYIIAYYKFVKITYFVDPQCCTVKKIKLLTDFKY